MGKFFETLSSQHKSFIEEQKMYFVASAPLEGSGHINLSPKGLDSFRILGDNKVGYMDVTGSGNETSAHILENQRLTFMFCSFDKQPLILRLYGQGQVVLPDTESWKQWSPHFNILPSTRQLILMTVDMVQTSCGFGVPTYQFIEDKNIHFKWAGGKDIQALEDYKKEKNWESLDGLPTHLSKEQKED
ncbi:MAG: hypothetical protein ACJA01_003878 [Saprospiraceae bacterium]|jgi:hypothetical protein